MTQSASARLLTRASPPLLWGSHHPAVHAAIQMTNAIFNMQSGIQFRGEKLRAHGMAWASLWTVLLLCALGATSASAADEPAAVTRALYAAFLDSPPQQLGQPYFQRVKTLLAPRLLRALAAQHAYEGQCKRSAAADFKPHMLDQNPFFYWPDDVKEVGELRTTIAANTATVLATVRYDSVTSQDAVRLERHKGRWRVSDIHWSDGGSLSARLREFMATPCIG